MIVQNLKWLRWKRIESIITWDPIMELREHYTYLYRKYLRDANEFLAKGDSIQASEKLWGATAEIVKAVAASRGIELKSHRDLWEFIDKLAEELKDPEIVRLFSIASSLHQNFYEAWMPLNTVKIDAEAVKQFVEKLEKLLFQFHS